MAEYIEREAVLKKMQLACRIALIDDDPEQCDIDFSDDFAVAVDDIVEIPAADVVPVVRCYQCKYYAKSMVLCHHEDGLAAPDKMDFCSYGEQRGDTDG